MPTSSNNANLISGVWSTTASPSPVTLDPAIFERYRQMTTRIDTGEINLADYMRGFASPSPKELKKRKDDELKRLQARDVEQLQQFIDTGSSDLQTYVDNKHVLYLWGWQGLMAIVNSRTIKVHKVGAKHVMKQLTALAEREGLELSVHDNLKEKPMQAIGFWLWKVRGEVDDSKLMTIREEPLNPWQVQIMDEEIPVDPDDVEYDDDLPF